MNKDKLGRPQVGCGRDGSLLGAHPAAWQLADALQGTCFAAGFLRVLQRFRECWGFWVLLRVGFEGFFGGFQVFALADAASLDLRVQFF